MPDSGGPRPFRHHSSLLTLASHTNLPPIYLTASRKPMAASFFDSSMHVLIKTTKLGPKLKIRKEDFDFPTTCSDCSSFWKPQHCLQSMPTTAHLYFWFLPMEGPLPSKTVIHCLRKKMSNNKQKGFVGGQWESIWLPSHYLCFEGGYCKEWVAGLWGSDKSNSGLLEVGGLFKAGNNCKYSWGGHVLRVLWVWISS